MGWIAAVTALVASSTTLSVALIATDRGVSRAAETALLDRARALQFELEREGDYSPPHVDEELSEFVHGDVTVAVDGPYGMLAGSPDLPRLGEERCEILGGDPTWIVCAAKGERGVWVYAGRPRALVLAHRDLLLSAGLVALVVVVLGSLIAALIVVRTSLAPLVRLVAAVDAMSPDSAALPRSGLAEVDRLAAALESATGRLTDELRRSRAFAADAAHELRTPLAKLRTTLELRGETLAPNSEAAAENDALVMRTKSLGELVDRLLLLASPQEALQAATLVSLAATVDSVAEEVGRPGRLALHLLDDGLVYGDATILAAMVSNALDNALKYAPGPIDVSVRRQDSDVVVRVDDTGPGLEPEHLERVFEPFYRAPDRRGAPGFGIGLALVAHVAAAHGGEARFVTEDSGAHLVISIPAASPS